jgi:peptidyl-prolyl cis-trans isomerase B (cyclophilin B)
MNKTLKTALIFIAMIVLIGGVYYLSRSGDDTTDSNQVTQENESETQLNDNQAPEGTIEQSAKPQPNDEIAIIKTSKGDITVRLFPEAAPETVKNFTELAKYGKYKDVKFHRVIKDFMIQTGDFEKGDGTGGYSYKGEGTNIDDEFHPDLTHIKGAVSMANAGPNTNGSQFFVVQAEEGTPHLNNMHSVFGQVIDGIDVVDEIASVRVGANDKPAEKITITDIVLKKYE